MEYRIDKAQKPDYPEITDVWEASVRATHHFLSEADIAYFRPLILNEYLAAVDLYCLRNPQAVIRGFLGVADHKIEMLFLHPGEFGSGLGKHLLQYALNQLGANKVDVNEQNEQAVGFYRHMGFVVVSRSPLDGLGKPFPILHMELG